MFNICIGCGRPFKVFNSELNKQNRLYCNRECQSNSVEQRFWSLVDVTDTCWLWTGAKIKRGYGYFRVGGRNELTHRYAWTLFRGPILDGLQVCHNCPDGDCPSCCRPDHCFLGTQIDNMQDASNKGMLGNSYGEEHPKSKLVESQVLELRDLYSKGVSQRELSHQFGITHQSVYAIVHGRSWKHLLPQNPQPC